MSAAVSSCVDQSFEINSRLDLNQVRDILRARRRVHITSILKSSNAKALHDELQRYPKWCLSLKEDGWDREMECEQTRCLSVVQEMEIRDLAYSSAGLQHAHLYKRAHLSRTYTPLVLKLYKFLNSTSFIEFARQATGLSQVSRVEMRAVCLSAGHFISSHNDAVELGEEVRRVGYLFQLTPNWRADWGGHLEFLSSDGGDTEEAYVPRFNSLVLFLIPQWHAVSMVVPFAKDSRYTLSGFIEGS